MTSIANVLAGKSRCGDQEAHDDRHQREEKMNKSIFENPEVEHEECTKHVEDLHIQLEC